MEVVGIFVSPLLKAVINKLLSSDLIDLARQGGVDTSIKKLKKSFEDINDVLADAEDKQISDNAVNKWLKELQHLAYDADDVLDEFATEVLRKKLIMADADVGEASTSSKVLHSQSELDAALSFDLSFFLYCCFAASILGANGKIALFVITATSNLYTFLQDFRSCFE